MSQKQDIIAGMLRGDFSQIESIQTRSGTVYRIFLPQSGEPRPEGVAMAPLSAEQTAKGLIVLGGIYGREKEGKKPDGTYLIPDGSVCPTTPISEISLRPLWREALLKGQKFSHILSVQTKSGRVYTFVRNSFEAMGATTPTFLPQEMFLVEGTLFLQGRLWGDSRCERGATVTLSNIDSLMLADGRKVNARKTLILEDAPMRTGMARIPVNP